MNHFPLVALLLTACGESWTWDATSANKDSGGDTAAPAHDLDGDGFIDTAFGGDDCWDDPGTTPREFTALAGTSQPSAADVHPDAPETWYDGVDQDCAGDNDFDQDGDTHRSATHADGTGAIGDDCYDALEDAYPSGAASCAREGDLAPAQVYPGATDLEYDGTDADCSGNDDFDQDGDGFGRCAECDDTDAAIFPNDDPEVWYDGVDANCDGNDGDQDGDGYYIEGYAFTIPPDFEPGDCVDTEATTHPNAADAWYDGTDADCLGNDDFDQDADGYTLSDDCDDTTATTFPDAPDTWYDGVDSDCLGDDDFDQDGDGYNSSDDCDDTRSDVNPGAAEDCATSADDDCDGDDNDVDALGCFVYYSDGDGDGYGAADACLCTATASYALVTGDDCDDADAAVNPGETEVCNDGVDNDCDGGSGSCGPTSASLSTAVEYTGEANSDSAGTAVSGGGDVNGDGFDDVIVGAHANSAGGVRAGAAYLVLGSASPSSSSLSTAVRYTGEAANDLAGYSVAGAGDVDGDGYDDLLIGAYQNADGGGNTGAAYLVLGSPAPSSASLSAAVQFTGEAVGDYAGGSGADSGGVAGAGDVNGDGYPDLVVGAFGNDDAGGNSGSAYLVLGSAVPTAASLSTAVQYSGESANDEAADSVSGAGDVDGDGYEDFVVGAPGNSGGGYRGGAAYLVLGSASPTSASLSTAVKYTGSVGEYAGYSASGTGDVDGDGYDDLIVGAFYNNSGGAEAGAAYLVLGSTSPTSTDLSTMVQYRGENAYDQAGRSVAGAGDVDGDGRDDTVIGAVAYSDGGAAYLVLGTSTPAAASLSAAVQYPAASAGEKASNAIAGVGDVDADGHGDLLVGAPGAGTTGAAYLILGQGL